MQVYPVLFSQETTDKIECSLERRAMIDERAHNEYQIWRNRQTEGGPPTDLLNVTCTDLPSSNFWGRQ